MTITASVVIYNHSLQDIRPLVKSLLDSPIDRIYIIDHSESASLENEISTLSEKISYIRHTNTGYGAGHNVALRLSAAEGSRYHLVVNPDVWFGPDVIPSLAEYMENHPDTAQMMPKVLFPDGKIQRLAKMCPTPFDLFRRLCLPHLTKKQNHRFELCSSGFDRIMDVPYLSGCFMFFRVKAVEEAGFFDERFFMYAEDIDMTRRLHKNYRTLFYPDACIYHIFSSASRRSVRLFLIHGINIARYFNKWGWFRDKERDDFNRKLIAGIPENIRISHTFLSGDAGSVSVPDFIYNRFDLYHPKESCFLITYDDGKNRHSVPFHISGSHAEAGIWKASVPAAVWDDITEYLFSTFKSVKKITYEYSLVKYRHGKTYNHFTINLPDTVEELNARLSAKRRYAFRRYERILKQLAPDCKYREYSGHIPDRLVEFFFESKLVTRSQAYSISPQEYQQKFHVTNAYTLERSDNEIIALVFSCEQTSVIYLDNMAYNVKYQKISPGAILWNSYLAESVKKGYHTVYLAGGPWKYKKSYGSIEETAYWGETYRNPFCRFVSSLSSLYKKLKSSIYLLAPASVREKYSQIKKRLTK